MIKINLQTPENLEMNRAVAGFVNELRSRSFAGRNPHLGPMINCVVCDRRHRRSQVCIPVYTKDDQDEDFICAQNTKKGVHGAQAYKGRILKHRNARGLQVLERATLLYRQDFEPYFADKDIAGKAALSRALNEIRAERKERRRTLWLITKESRRINRTS